MSKDVFRKLMSMVSAIALLVSLASCVRDKGKDKDPDLGTPTGIEQNVGANEESAGILEMVFSGIIDVEKTAEGLELNGPKLEDLLESELEKLRGALQNNGDSEEPITTYWRTEEFRKQTQNGDGPVSIGMNESGDGSVLEDNGDGSFKCICKWLRCIEYIDEATQYPHYLIRLFDDEEKNSSGEKQADAAAYVFDLTLFFSNNPKDGFRSVEFKDNDGKTVYACFQLTVVKNVVLAQEGRDGALSLYDGGLYNPDAFARIAAEFFKLYGESDRELAAAGDHPTL